MVTALVLISVERSRVNDVAQEVAQLPGVSEVYSVSGRYDVVAIIRVSSNEQLADLVTNRMLKVEGILNSETMVAFRTESRHDLESMFSIGMEEQ